MMKVTLLIIISSLLAACGSYVSRYEKMILVTPPETLGYIIGSYTINCSPFTWQKKDNVNPICSKPDYSSQTTVFRDVNDNEIQGSIGIVPNLWNGTIAGGFENPSNDEIKIYFCKAIPEGSYEFFGVSTNGFQTHGSESSLFERNYFSAPFTINKKKLTYVGNFRHVTKVNKDNILFSSRFARIPDYLSIRNHYEKDISKAVEKCPEGVKNNAVVTSVPNLDKFKFK